MAHDLAQERKLQEEEVKLSAAWFNGLSLAFMVVGFVQPVVARSFSVWPFLLLIVGGVLHMFARFWLRRWFPRE